MSTPPFASASLYVGDLNADVTEALLFEIFNDVGPVASVRVCRDAASRRSLGYAYVNFHQVEDAERALDTMNFKNIRGRACRIMWSHRDPSLRKSGVGNIFVKNLAKSIDNKTLYDTFSMFGNILSCKVAINGKRESLGYGFVHYESKEAALNAISKVNGKMIADQKVTVSYFKSKQERGGDAVSYTNLFVKNLPLEFKKEALDKLFAKYGDITSSVVKQDVKKTGSYGFVNFKTPESAAAAVAEMHNLDFESKKLYVQRAQKKEEREKELRERSKQFKVERQKKYAGVNLYVKNLADHIDEDKLKEEFAKYGQITSAKIMRDDSGKSKGFGFVCFSTPEEASKCKGEMSGRMLDQKPLYVAFAQPRDLRRQQLEAKHRQSHMPAPQMFPPNAPGGQPMFFNGPPQRGNFVYPQQMMQRGWAPGQPRPQMMPMRGPPVNYQLMPMNQSRPGQGNQRRNSRRQNGQPKQQGQNIKYTEGVRNRGPQPVPQQQMPQQQQQQQQPQSQPQGGESNQMIVKQLMNTASEEEKNQILGESLFPRIKALEPEYAGKITGMLLEMDNGELIELLESPSALAEKVSEAMMVLEASTN